MKRKSLVLLALLCIALALTACGKDASVKVGEVQEINVSSGVIKAINTEDLKANLHKEDWIIVDTRINDAFNGWKLDGVKRGGHIEGAADFAANWLTVEDKEREAKLEKVLLDKGIVAEKNIVLYDANGKDAQLVADYLSEKGFENLYIYDVKQWAEDDSLPMVSYENYSMIVPASWINELITNNNNGSPYKIFEVSWGEVSEEYNSGHIPGAVHINTDEVEEGPVWNRKSVEDLEKFAVNYGITADTTVVLYGGDSMAAFRVAVILRYMGVEDVRVLNGGFNAWVVAGYEVDTKPHDKTPVASFGITAPANPNYIVDLSDAKEILEDRDNSVLVDIRSWDEHIGKTSGYSYISAKGRPAGSVWGHDMDAYRNIDGTMRNASEILSMWQEWNIKPEQGLSFFCGTGWRAAEVLVYADVMGLQNISLYDGGWNEWSGDSKNPIEIGEPKK